MLRLILLLILYSRSTMLLISLLLKFTVEVVALVYYLLFKLLDTPQLILLFCARLFQLLLVANRLLTPSLFHHF